MEIFAVIGGRDLGLGYAEPKSREPQGLIAVPEAPERDDQYVVALGARGAARGYLVGPVLGGNAITGEKQVGAGIEAA